MKYVFVFFALYLIASTSGLTAKSRAAAEAANKAALASLKRVHSSKLGRTLIETIQIELNSGTKTDPRPRIRQLLQEILDNTQEAIVNLNINIASSRDNCEKNQDQLDSDISKLQDRIEDDSSEQDNVQVDLASQVDQHDVAVSLGANYEDQLYSTQTSRDNRRRQYEQTNDRLQRIRSALEQTRAYITDRIQSRSNPSFLQKNNMLVEVKRKVMSPDFQAASAGWGKFISFLATKALNKIRQTPDDEASEGLGAIVNVINDIIDSVNKDIASNDAAEESDKISTEEAVERLQSAIDSAGAQIAALALNIAHDQGRLGELALSLASNKEILSNKQASLTASDLSCQQGEAEYGDLFSQRNEELDIIQEVLDLLNNSLNNLRELTENVVQKAQVDEE